MNRRASLPGAEVLFRAGPDAPERGGERPGGADRASSGAGGPDLDLDVGEASGRVRHDQKITVYLTAQELLDLEQARLRLRAEFDLGVDRGRIVREAIAELLQDLYDRGPDSALVRRLS